MVGKISVNIKEMDGVLDRFSNQLGALGKDKARAALARAVNHTAKKSFTAVKRALARQTSIPRPLVEQTIKLRLAAHKGATEVEAVIYARGSELPMKVFKPRQFSFGTRAKVWGKMQRFPHTFGAPGGPPKLVAALGGNVYVRSGSERTPIERVFGPSIPKEMVLGATKDAFQKTASEGLNARIEHEIARLLPG